MSQEKIKGMRSIFHDTDLNTDYDRLIDEARKRMEKQNPIERVADIEFTISSLKSMKDTYWPRFPEGFNFGFFTPHKSRIERRITSLESEKKAHLIERDEYLRQEKQKHDDQEREKERKLEIEKENIKSKTIIEKTNIFVGAAKVGKKTKTNTEEQNGVVINLNAKL